MSHKSHRIAVKSRLLLNNSGYSWVTQKAFNSRVTKNNFLNSRFTENGKQNQLITHHENTTLNAVSGNTLFFWGRGRGTHLNLGEKVLQIEFSEHKCGKKSNNITRYIA